MTIPDAHLKHIGRVAVNFQFLETVIFLYMSELIGSEQKVGLIIATQLPFGRLCATTRALFEHRYQDALLRARFGELIVLALELESRRNQYFHSAWVLEDESNSVIRVKSKINRKELAVDYEVIKEYDLEQFNEKLKNCCILLSSFGKEIGLFCEQSDDN